MNVKVYGAGWCHDTQDTLRHLKELGVAHTYIDVEENAEAAEWVRQHNDGKERKPHARHRRAGAISSDQPRVGERVARKGIHGLNTHGDAACGAGRDKFERNGATLT
jgi:glutaredoxin